ncbi:hypothetical protein GCM10009681_26340 [Luedemannella helvata]|uniref:Uncharacterized protein n=1 Tax=Luedemannella helvata TaxID=349315 RepID=A0ABN2KE05_9ACTN
MQHRHSDDKNGPDDPHSRHTSWFSPVPGQVAGSQGEIHVSGQQEMRHRVRPSSPFCFLSVSTSVWSDRGSGPDARAGMMAGERHSRHTWDVYIQI